ncbi:MAG: KpsF/GutQ family sugar-phosphate isomerase [Caulobacteraceae bacterium]
MTDFDAVTVGQRVLSVEAQALDRLAASLGPSFTGAVEVLYQAKGRIACMGVGKSGHVARKIAATLSSTGAKAMFVHLAEASHGDLGMIDDEDVILVLSKSGEVRELADTLAYAKRFSIPLLAITSSPRSTLARAADLSLLIPDAPEATAEVSAPTTSTTLQMALGDALAVALLERRGFTAGQFRVLHPGGRIGAMLTTVADLMHGESELPIVAPYTPMQDTLLVMTEKRFGCVAVCDEHQRLQGVITDGDLRRHMDGLMTHAAGDVMTRSPKTVPPGMLAAEALKRMNEAVPPVTVLFAVEEDRPVGILHIHDLLRAGVI